MNLTYYLKSKLLDLLSLAYKDNCDEEMMKSFKYFNIELSKKTTKKSEEYKDRKIIIFNLYRKECEIANSLIIGLSHHIDFCIRGETDNRKPFCEIYQSLLYLAFQDKMISYDELIKSQDYKDKKLIQNATNIYFEDIKNEESCIIEVFNSFNIKEYLKQHKFKYNTFHQSWEIEVKKTLLNKAIEILLLRDESIIIETRSPSKIIFGLTAFVCISGYTYKYKDLLKENHYFFKDNKWLKKIQANYYLIEKEQIEKALPKGQGIKVSIEYF